MGVSRAASAWDQRRKVAIETLEKKLEGYESQLRELRKKQQTKGADQLKEEVDAFEIDLHRCRDLLARTRENLGLGLTAWLNKKRGT